MRNRTMLNLQDKLRENGFFGIHIKYIVAQYILSSNLSQHTTDLFFDVDINPSVYGHFQSVVKVFFLWGRVCALICSSPETEETWLPAFWLHLCVYPSIPVDGEWGERCHVNLRQESDRGHCRYMVCSHLSTHIAGSRHAKHSPNAELWHPRVKGTHQQCNSLKSTTSKAKLLLNSALRLHVHRSWESDSQND